MPEGWENRSALEIAGRTYYEARATFMVRSNEGLTRTYNRFHDPEERSPEIGKLRELHATMDRAVLDAYGWTDLKPQCEFILDYDDNADEENGGRARRKPWRFRWVDSDRDEVLARLLALNKERAEKEVLAGTLASPPSVLPKKAKAKGATIDPGQGTLF
jgi:hypothetical protein